MPGTDELLEERLQTLYGDDITAPEVRPLMRRATRRRHRRRVCGGLAATAILGCIALGAVLALQAEPAQVDTVGNPPTTETPRPPLGVVVTRADLLNMVTEETLVVEDQIALIPLLPGDQVLADPAAISEGADHIPEDVQGITPTVLVGRAKYLLDPEREATPLIVLLFEGVISVPLGGPVPVPGEAPVDVQPGPATVTALFDGLTGEYLGTWTVGCIVRSPCEED